VSIVNSIFVKIDLNLQDKSKIDLVYQPEVSHLILILAIKMNVLYDGVENPVEILVPVISSD
jgi:hypothetical protein